MKIKLTMVSGQTIEFESPKYHNFDDWLKANFQEKGVWWKPFRDINKLLKFDSIESIEEV